ncbi:exported hypothetical protein [Mesorhizobium plurifarium]|uniref:Uncharacterized protein n=1 Tax=Mesorhizobium plurifarium TaxID=69974 RepID=A0A090FML1_MESPL|nr:exported hypothetical protein [Mesorhizobium plurifarium]
MRFCRLARSASASRSLRAASSFFGGFVFSPIVQSLTGGQPAAIPQWLAFWPGDVMKAAGRADLKHVSQNWEPVSG